MNARIIGLIIGREYLNRVRKKSFLLITFISPVLFAALCILPSLIMLKAKEEGKKIAVVDRSGLVASTLSDSETLSWSDCAGTDIDSLKTDLAARGYDAVLGISPLDSAGKTVTAEIFSTKPLGVDMTENISRRINKAVEDYRVRSYGIEGLDEIMKDVKGDVRLRSYTIGEDGKEEISEARIYMLVSMILGMILYMFIALFGGMVMSSVIEEKSSRIVEVLVSSVKATELMFGKIIGIALVALTQFLLWILLTIGIVGVAGAALGEDYLAGADSTGMVQMAGVDAARAEALVSAASEPGRLDIVMQTFRNMPLGTILLAFLLYFIFGYMLYASLFAAVGSAVDNEGDSQQLQLPITVPLLIGFFIALYAYKAPDSAIAFWGSMIPFTSPIVMLARLPFGVPAWELAVSLAVLVLTFAGCAWLSAKVYKVGILMFGKKSGWKDIWKWAKQK